jgi:hypothetical protein
MRLCVTELYAAVAHRQGQSSVQRVGAPTAEKAHD